MLLGRVGNLAAKSAELHTFRFSRQLRREYASKSCERRSVARRKTQETRLSTVVGPTDL